MKGLLAFLGASIIGVLIVSPVLFLTSFRTVDSGEVAVVTRFGAVTGRVLEPGAHFITPFVEGTKYVNTKFLLYETMKTKDIELSSSDYKDGQVDTNTKDGQGVDLFYTIRFSIDPTQVVSVIENFGSEEALVDKIVRAESRSVARVVPSNYEAETLYVGEGKAKVGQDIFEQIEDKFNQNAIILDSVLIREIGFNPEYIAAIEEQQREAVRVGTAQQKAEQAKYEKESRITQAEGQAKEQELQRATISDELLEKMWIEQWDGKLPMYMTGDAQNLIQLPNQLTPVLSGAGNELIMIIIKGIIMFGSPPREVLDYEREEEPKEESYVKQYKKARTKHEELVSDLKSLITRSMSSWSYSLRFDNEEEGEFHLTAKIDKGYGVVSFSDDEEFNKHVNSALNKLMPQILSEAINFSKEDLNGLAREARREAEDIMNKVKELEEEDRGDQTLVS